MRAIGRGAAALAALAPAPAAALCTPGDACWPGGAAWAELNASVGGRLAALAPPACAGTSMTPGERAAEASCTMWDSTQHDGASLRRGAITPQYAVRAETTADVQAAARFASAHGVRLTVKSTGHCFVGRSNAGDGLLVWLHDLNAVDLVEGWAGNCSAGPAPVARVAGGAQWSDVYPRVAPKYHAVGGNALSVGAAGGFLQGGGHSVLSPSLGLSVDSVAELEVVLPTGELRVASPCANEELFWALRGGGGGTFGVVTAAVLRLHPVPEQVVGLTVGIPLTINGSGEVSDAARGFMAAYVAMQPTLHRCWGGYLLGGQLSPAICPPGPCLLLHTLCNAGWDTASASIAPLKAWFDGYYAANPAVQPLLVWMMDNHTSFWDWHGPTTDPVGGSQQLASRIVPPENFAAPEKAAALAATILKYAAGGTPELPCMFYVVQLGGAVAEADPDGATAVPAAYRGGQWHVVFAETGYDAATEDRALSSVAAFQQEIAEQTPGSGAYVNEMMYAEPGWQTSFFGDNYPRLLALKRAVDPAGVLRCHHCVGDDGSTPAPAPRTPAPPATPAPGPADSCALAKCEECCTGQCAACKACVATKAGPCAPCWAVDPTRGAACLYDDEHGCRTCWAPPPAPPAPAPPAPPAPPSPSQCPAGSLAGCMAICPASPASAYTACVRECGVRCPRER